MGEVFIVSAVRTPIGRFLGALADFSATKLGSIAIREAVARAGITGDMVDEVIMGNVVSAGIGQAPARQAMLYAGLPPQVSVFTINMVCGSGLQAVALASRAIAAGDADIVVAGGMESMSNVPYAIPKARTGARLGNAELVDLLVFDGLWDIYENFHMGCTAELVQQKYGISRREQDEFAEWSHRKAVAATKEGKFKEEMVTIEIPQKKGPPIVVDKDEGPRDDTSLEKLAKLPPAFQKDGTVTAGNASQISDGACALVVMSERKVKELGVKPLARITGYATGGVEPKWVMMAPLEAVKNLHKKTGRKIADYDLYEVNEPFAVATIALTRELGLDPSKLNISGGAVALGHPIGATGARILTTLIYGLRKRGGKRGLATLCLGGGNAVAMSIESC